MGLFSRTIPFSNKIIRIIKYLKNYDKFIYVSSPFSFVLAICPLAPPFLTSQSSMSCTGDNRSDRFDRFSQLFQSSHQQSRRES